MGIVEAIHIKPGSRIPMQPVRQARLVAGLGIEGDAAARQQSKRQVLVMPAEVLDAFGLPAGAVRENITTRGFDVMALRRGQRVRIGEALLETTLECAPCGLMDHIRPGLQEALRGQRGMLFRVVLGGMVNVGDLIEVVEDTQPGDGQ